MERQLMHDTSLAEWSMRIQANVENVRFHVFGETPIVVPKINPFSLETGMFYFHKNPWSKFFIWHGSVQVSSSHTSPKASLIRT